MVGKVFISCGQREGEREIAEKVKGLLKEKFALESYLAFKVQGLDDIMKITEELKASDYYLFIDFKRAGKQDLACSLFTHQELALAHHVGFRDIIALQEEGMPLEGFLRYVLSNPEHFETEEELLQKIEQLVRDKGWNKDYSRNLVIAEVKKYSPVVTYTDQTGAFTEFIWHAKVVNKRPDIAAVNAVCILDSITGPNGIELKSKDRSYLKWAQHTQSYMITILPQDFGVIDIFSVRASPSGVFLHSALDSQREAIILTEGLYKLKYKLFSSGFPLLPFIVEVNYHPSDGTNFSKNNTEARLL